MMSRVILAAKGMALSLLVVSPLLVRFLLESDQHVDFRREPAAELIASGQYSKAYRQLLRQDPAELELPERARLEYQLAVCDGMLDRPGRARSRLQHLEYALPILEDYRRLWLARALEDLGNREAAIEAYLEFLTRGQHPELCDLGRVRLAELYAQGGELDQALKLCHQLESSATVHLTETWFRAGKYYGIQGESASQRRTWLALARDYPGSQRALEAMQLLPPQREPTELNLRAAVDLAHKNYAAAARTLRSLLDSYPQHQFTSDGRYRLGNAYAGMGQYDRAMDAYREVFEASRRPSALYGIGGLQVRQNQDSQAIGTYERFLRLFPHHALADDALWQAAKAAERSDDFGAAEGFYRRLAEQYPDSDLRDEAGWCIGFMFYCQGEYRKALVVFTRLEHMAREPHIVDQSLFWAAKAATRLGDTAAADQFYKRAATGFPRSYYSSRAVALGHASAAAVAPRPDALPLRRSAAPTAGFSHPEYLLRADALSAIGLRDLARRELERAETLNGNRPEALEEIRDRYESDQMLDQAMRLSVRIYGAAKRVGEIHHIFPNYYWEQVSSAAAEAQVDPYLVLSVIRQESSFNPAAESRVGALGLMQLMPQTGQALARTLGLNPWEREQLLDPEISIRLGSHFLGERVREFASGPGEGMRFELGLAAYNAGAHNAHRWLEDLPHADADAFVERIPYRETRKYVKLVLRNYTIYKALSDA
jgi:soluble lytic murein transglycosylase